MKKATVALLLLLTPGLAFACDKGCFPFKDTCACEIQPELAKPVQPSDERPPSDRMPSYQREGVVIVDAKETATEDARLDREKAEADVIGKRAAGIK